MVTSGFSLLELRHLYIDEFFDFYQQLIFVQEQSGQIKKGTYDRLENRGESTVKNLRSQIFKVSKPKSHG